MDETRRWVTMRDVADRAGVAKITVSRVLRTPDAVRPDTRDRVLAAIRDLGYVPHEGAVGLSSRKSGMVGALVSTLAGSVFASTIDGLSHALRREGRELLLASTDYSELKESDLIATLLGRRPDGLVLTSTEHAVATRALLDRAGIPVVEVWELPEDPVDCAVGFSNRDAGRAMTRFLAELGHRRIGFVGNTHHGDLRGRLRASGYLDAVRDLGIGAPRMLVSDNVGRSAAEVGAEGLRTLLARWPDTTAVFCVSDLVALGVANEARRCGLQVPEGLAIAGFGDFDFAGAAGLGLTTVRVPGFEIGEAAARLIHQRATDRGKPGKTLDLGFRIVRRMTA